MLGGNIPPQTGRVPRARSLWRPHRSQKPGFWSGLFHLCEHVKRRSVAARQTFSRFSACSAASLASSRWWAACSLCRSGAAPRSDGFSGTLCGSGGPEGLSGGLAGSGILHLVTDLHAHSACHWMPVVYFSHSWGSPLWVWLVFLLTAQHKEFG